MKNKFIGRLRIAMFTITVITVPYFSFAQDPGPCPDCPIDDGVILLIAVGVLYGLKKYWTFTSEKNKNLEVPS